MMATTERLDPQTIRLHDTTFADLYSRATEAWERTDEDSRGGHEVESETAPARKQPEAELLVGHYFADVRQYALLRSDEEQLLWQQIETWGARVRRALYTSPVALAVLTDLWQQVREANLPLTHVVCVKDAAREQQDALLAQFETAVGALQALHTAIQALHTQRQAGVGTAQQRRALRRRLVRLWRQWLATWEALNLRPGVLDTIEQAWEVEGYTDVRPPALRAAQTAWKRAQHALDQAKTRMLHANLRLVIHVANRYRNRVVPLLDLIQEGNIGLMRALEKFDPHYGVKFATYAHWWVRQAITRAISEQQRTIRLPGHIIDRQSKLRTISDRFWDVHGRAPRAQELSTALGCTPSEVNDLIVAGLPLIRLHQPSDEDSATLIESIRDEQALAPEEWTSQSQLHHSLEACLASLTDRESYVLRLRYGLGTDRPHTLQETGDLIGLSRERVRQIEKQALQKLQHPQQRDQLVDFVNVA